MISLRIYITSVICVLFIATACDDIFEENINETQVLLVAPGDSIRLSTGEISFFWEPLKGASRYHLQIAKGSFDNVVSIASDTLVTKNQYKLTLTVGKYAWRVRAENSGYQSPYSYRSFEVGI